MAALAALTVAHGECLDVAFSAVQRHAKEDLAAAYFVRAQRRSDPVDYLHALNAAEQMLRQNPRSREALFNRALAQEKLGLTAEAIRSWDEVVKVDRSAWGKEAGERRKQLLQAPDPTDQWSRAALEKALRERDSRALTKIARAFPAEAERYFEESNLLDLEASRLFARILLEGGDAYAWDIVSAMERTRDRDALERGIQALREARESRDEQAYARAAELLERAGNPLYLAARYGIAASRFVDRKESLPILDEIPTSRAHRDLSARVHTLRAVALEQRGGYIDALKAYDEALEIAQGDATPTVAALTRRSLNYAAIGNTHEAFRDALAALPLLPRTADLNARFHALESAATAARDFGYRTTAFHYFDAAVAMALKAVARAPTDRRAKNFLAVALRARATSYLDLGREVEAQEDLQQALQLAESIGDEHLRFLLRMRIHEVRGDLLVTRTPADAIAELTKAIDLAAEQNSTYRATLHFKRAAARRTALLPGADEDITEALRILREEAQALLETRKRGEYEHLWKAYFSRFQQMQHQLIESLIRQNDIQGAFVYTELARAFEPMHMLLQLRSAPSEFSKIESVGDLRQQLASLPDDTVILQYVVLDDKTYAWVLTRDQIRVVRLMPGRNKIERWVADVTAIVEGNQPKAFSGAMIAPYEELFRPALEFPEAAARKRLVIVPDGPMHALPFAALRASKDGRFLLERYSIAVAGSTSLYLYSLHRNHQPSATAKTSVLVVGDPAFDPAIGRRLKLDPLEYAHEEALQLARDYPGARLLVGSAATTSAFLSAAKNADIIHFAGHGVANPHSPWNSMLVLARDGNDSGELTAARLLSEVVSLDRTRLVLLAACSSASGHTVGPEGVAPLVRPLIAASVPAVVGTLWDINDATTKNLTVSLHCRYRNGDDVAVALQQAQLEMLRKKVPAMHWASFQVAGYAASPYERRIAMEKTHHDHVCSENSLHRPDGLHPQ